MADIPRMKVFWEFLLLRNSVWDIIGKYVYELNFSHDHDFHIDPLKLDALKNKKKWWSFDQWLHMISHIIATDTKMGLRSFCSFLSVNDLCLLTLGCCMWWLKYVPWSPQTEHPALTCDPSLTVVLEKWIGRWMASVSLLLPLLYLYF